MSCSTSTTENRPLSRPSTPTSRVVSSRPVPAVGSSSSSNFGSMASAMASSSARFSPCESCPARMCARSARPTSASASMAGSFNAGSIAALPRTRKLEPARACTASATFSSAENPGKDGTDLERSRQAQSCARVHRQGRDVAVGKHDFARVGGSQPGNLIDQRRLAGPIRSNDGMQLVRHDVESEVVGHDQGAEFLLQPLEAEQGFSHGRASAPRLRRR